MLGAIPMATPMSNLPGYGTLTIDQTRRVAEWSPVGLLGSGLPPDQGALVLEVASACRDIQQALNAMRPLSIETDVGDVASLLAVVGAELDRLRAEVGRPDLPRPQRIKVLIGSLIGFQNSGQEVVGDLNVLLQVFQRETPQVARNFLDEQQSLKSVVQFSALQLYRAWLTYQYGGITDPTKEPPDIWPLGAAKRVATTSQPSNSFSQRAIDAQRLLPVLAQDAIAISSALDAIGFGPGAQEAIPLNELENSFVDADLTPAGAIAANFSVQLRRAKESKVDGDGPVARDIIDWATDISQGLDLVASASQLGLNLLADEADELFYVVQAILTTDDPSVTELTDGQVQVELLTLARDLSLVADLCSPLPFKGEGDTGEGTA
jgi:hypothetical protein